MEILLIRHGQSEADILHVHEGRADFPLTELGRKQARLMAKKVKSEFPPDFIWASPLKRARETAVILAETVGCPLQFEDDLMEHNNGVLAGLTFEEAKKHPIPTTLHDRFENGESVIEFRMRIEMAFSKILSSSKHDRIAIVAHGGVMHSLLRSFFKMPVNLEYGFLTGDTGIHLLEVTENDKLVHFLNNTSHISI